MGQKINPVGFRVGVIRDWESKWYLDKGYADAVIEDMVLVTDSGCELLSDYTDTDRLIIVK